MHWNLVAFQCCFVSPFLFHFQQEFVLATAQITSTYHRYTQRKDRKHLHTGNFFCNLSEIHICSSASEKSDRIHCGGQLHVVFWPFSHWLFIFMMVLLHCDVVFVSISKCQCPSLCMTCYSLLYWATQCTISSEL